MRVMARYIDAEELLNKRPFTISGGKPSDYLEGFLDCVDEAKEAINNTPTADVVEVVKCKDCGLRKTNDCAMYYACDCGGQFSWENDNDFCSYGERK